MCNYLQANDVSIAIICLTLQFIKVSDLDKSVHKNFTSTNALCLYSNVCSIVQIIESKLWKALNIADTFHAIYYSRHIYSKY